MENGEFGCNTGKFWRNTKNIFIVLTNERHVFCEFSKTFSAFTLLMSSFNLYLLLCSISVHICVYRSLLDWRILKSCCNIVHIPLFQEKPYIIVPWTKMFPPIDVYCERAFKDLASEEGGKEKQEHLKSQPKVNLPDFLAHNNLYIETCGAESDKKSDMKKMTCLIFRELSAEQVLRAFFIFVFVHISCTIIE